MTDWGKRVFTVVIGMPAGVLILQSHGLSFSAVLLFLFLSLYEYKVNICPAILQKAQGTNAKGLSKDEPIRQSEGLGLITALAALLSSAAFLAPEHYETVETLSWLLTFLYHVGYLPKHSGNRVCVTSFSALGLDLLGLAFIVRGYTFAIRLRNLGPFGPGYQVLGCLCMWNADNGGILFGRALGGVKLIPNVSPGKTVAGVGGSVLSSTLTALALGALCASESSRYQILPGAPLELFGVIGLALGLASIFGDLTESYVKRVAGVKDSGSFFPGHGGVLDRFDSMLFVMPVLYHICTAIFP